MNDIMCNELPDKDREQEKCLKDPRVLTKLFLKNIVSFTGKVTNK